MKILFVLSNLSNNCGANVGIMLNIMNSLAEKNEIHALVSYDSKRPIDEKKKNIFKKVYELNIEKEGMVDFAEKSNWRNLSSFKKISWLMYHPIIAYRLLYNKFFDKTIVYKKYSESLEEICRKENYDIVFGVAAPYHILLALKTLKTPTVKVGFQLDPYTYNYTRSTITRNYRRRLEKEVIDELDILFAVSFVYNEIQKKNIYSNMKKIVSFELPGISTKECIYMNKFCDENVHFVFTGQFYKNIREPDYLLKLFEKLPDNYILHIVGGGCEDIIEKYHIDLGNRMICHGWVDRDEALSLMQKADVLVNINNTITNQMPSKVFEYISTGKPVLNICKTDKCLSLNYTRKYTNCLNIIESEDNNTVVLDIKKFVQDKKGVVIGRKEILRIFKNHTEDYLIELVEKNLRILFEGRDGKR